jgi:hypothetical protein
MKKKWIPICILFLSIILGNIGCEKSGTNCLTNTGKVIFDKRIVSDFDSIDVGDYVNLYLTQDSVIDVTVESGQNIIDGITSEVNNRTLFIRNVNKCNWLRSYNTKVSVHVSVKNLAKIFYNSSGNINTVNTITSSKLSVIAWGGCGTIDLKLNIKEGAFSLVMGTADFKLHGHSSITSIFSRDFGLIDARDLTTGYTFVKNEGSNDCYVNCSQFMEATIGSIGNIYYTGSPDSVITYIYGSGQVIQF